MAVDVDELLERARRFAMPEGDVEPRDIHFAQRGEMRLAPGAPWLRFWAEQWMSGVSMDFRWRAWFRMARFAPVLVEDAFENAAGALKVRAFGVLPIGSGKGPDFDRGEAIRGLAELPWRPFALGRQAHVTWEAGLDGRLMATYDDGRTSASAALEIDREGRIIGGSAIRPRLDGKRLVETPWFGSFSNYRSFGRVRVPTSAEVAWILPEGPFTYWRGRVIAFGKV
jgi:hypothetical protein